MKVLLGALISCPLPCGLKSCAHCCLQAVTELSIADNRLTALPDDWSGCSSLQKLHAYGNQLQQLPLSPQGLPALLPAAAGSDSAGGHKQLRCLHVYYKCCTSGCDRDVVALLLAGCRPKVSPAPVNWSGQLAEHSKHQMTSHVGVLPR
jgi:hypothetical protein